MNCTQSIVAAVLLSALVAVPAKAQDAEARLAVFNPFQLMTLNLELDPADWDAIRRDMTFENEVPAQFWAEGEAPILVSVRRKSSRALPSESNPVKVGLKIDINEFVSQKWHGLIKLSLENGVDSGVLSEGFAWNVHRLASGPEGYGYPAALAAWVQVVVNGQLLGVYLNAEQRDKQMLKNLGVWVDKVGGIDKTWLYDQHDMSTIELEEGNPHSPTFTRLCYSPFSTASRKQGGCARPDDPTLDTQLNAFINMQAMLTQCAVDAITVNDDSLCRHGHNFLFADFADGIGRRRMYFPWDLDQVFGKTSANIYANGGGRRPSMNPYQDVILRHSTFRAQYNNIMIALLTGPVSQGSLQAFLDALEPVLRDALDVDPYPTEFGAAAKFDQLSAWVLERVPIILAQVAANNNPPPR